MKTFIKVFLLVILLLISVPILVAGYFGFVPGLSGLMGSNKPRDLGVTFTEADRRVAYDNNGVDSVALTSASSVSDSIRYEGQKDVTTTFSSAEISALINSVTWKYMPVSRVQIKINPDGIGEASGILHLDKLLPYISLTASIDQVKAALDKYHISANPAFYLKGGVTIINNQVTFNPQIIEVGRMTIPQSLVTPNIPAATSFAESRIKSVPNLNIKSLTLTSGKINFSATVPAKEYTAR